MAIGIAGDSGSLSGISSDNLAAIELRVISILLQSLLGTSQQAKDELRVLRNDQAFELGITPPVVPGN